MKKTTKGIVATLCFCMVFSSLFVSVSAVKPKSAPMMWMTIEPWGIDITLGTHISGNKDSLGSWYDGYVGILSIAPYMSFIMVAYFRDYLWTYSIRVAVDAPSCTGLHYSLYVVYKNNPVPVCVATFNSLISGYRQFGVNGYITLAFITHDWHIPLITDPWEHQVRVFAQRCLVPV